MGSSVVAGTRSESGTRNEVNQTVATDNIHKAAACHLSLRLLGHEPLHVRPLTSPANKRIAPTPHRSRSTTMLTEELVSAIGGPLLAANTSVPKDVGIYTHTVAPAWRLKASFKKSSVGPRCLAVSDNHVFAAQDQKAHVHVYSRQRGNQESLVSFQERIRSLALAGNVLLLGTAEGRLMLWEAVSCLAATDSHVLTASDDSNINVWSLARLLEYGADPGFEPDLTLSNHRGAITSLVVAPGDNAETSLCVSASKDKTCIIWNYQTGQVLRTLLFPSIPLCTTLDPCARALIVAVEDGSIFLVEFFGDKPLLGSRAAEQSSIVVQVQSPLGVADADAGPATCLALDYNGTTLITGHTKGKILKWNLTDNSHPAELANLNAAVTNLSFVPLFPSQQSHQAPTVVKPNQSQHQYTLSTQLVGDSTTTRFAEMLNTPGFSDDTITRALHAFATSAAGSDAATLQYVGDLDHPAESEGAAAALRKPEYSEFPEDCVLGFEQKCSHAMTISLLISHFVKTSQDMNQGARNIARRP
ncbi:WD domain containing protein [Cordyceps militaris CM01]|uniref:Pre-rRNA-processing protein IPI3 n=1 Tax=Cordyceps militaris (strain CM01) TaxID=983644 RepID=G3JF04_CORMM|nr:WD domain containing protein [Cordyceps militaris CM01]EGX93060.1 WD domain containing protein [Cordyceps militaris CM01]